MSKELPYFKFFPTEWMLGRINNETASKQVAFLKICCLYWQKDCKMSIVELQSYVSLDKINYLITKEYISSKYKKAINKTMINIKFLDEQKIDLSDRRKKKVEAGKKGGIQSAKSRKKKTREDYLKAAINNSDPNLRLPKEVAEKLIDSKIKRGEIVL